jgi:hypothetical protein
VVGTSVEFNVFLPQVGTTKGCARFLGVSAVPNPYSFTAPAGFGVTCRNLVAPLPYGANLVITGLAAGERAYIADGHKTYSFVAGASTAFAAAAELTCFNCTADPEGATREAGKTARVLTYNTKLSPGTQLGAIFTDYVWSDSGALEIADRLEGFGVVGLQEVFYPGDNGRKLKIIERAAGLGLKHYAIPQATVPSTSTKDSGLLILSRYPIVAKDFAAYTTQALATFAGGI